MAGLRSDKERPSVVLVMAQPGRLGCFDTGAVASAVFVDRLVPGGAIDVASWNER